MSDVNPTFTEEELQNEEWRPVVGFELLYEVSTVGRVRSIRQRTSSKPGHILRNRGHKITKYVSVILTDRSLQRTCLVHRLVAQAFLGEVPEGYQVNHKDGDKLDNRLSNLEYMTGSENQRHAVAIGLKTFDSIRGEKNVNAKSTDDQIRLIRLRLREGVRVNTIAREFGIPYQRVQGIRDGKIWSHVR